ncbi:MAG: hypothetical protein LBG58_00875 [Planctomycetaceae bacterium]|jgi:hypothetical protein|nr:hypothetical protein [Planctomycetaceae bacterium]
MNLNLYVKRNTFVVTVLLLPLFLTFLSLELFSQESALTQEIAPATSPEQTVNATFSVSIAFSISLELPCEVRQPVQEISSARNNSNSTPKQTTQAKPNLDDWVWEIWGIRYTPMLKEEYKQQFAQHLTDRPHGGVVVKAVREGSLMAKTNIMPGDVIVGIHEWVTTSQNDIRYIAKHWHTVKTPKGTVEIELFRDGQLYFTEISLK